MDEDKFLQKLSEIADWFRPVTSESSGALRKPYKNVPDHRRNDTIPPMIEKIKELKKPCDWCGKKVIRKVNWTRPIASRKLRTRSNCWIGHCSKCNIWRDQDGNLTTRDPRY